MNYYLAPLEGITTYIYRNAYHHYFGGIDKYFTQFISSKKMGSRELNDILPEHNEGLHLVPQILTNRTDEVLALAKSLSEYGYTTINLNLGCPSGTVVAKKRGSGFLSVPELLDHFLYEIFDQSPIHISIKTRIGISSLDEWDTLLSIYEKYPIEELIIHPRLQKEFYSGVPHLDAYQKATEQLQIPLCYNGDITDVSSYQSMINQFPEIERIMLGRGILRNPFLVSELQGEVSSNKDVLRAFHDEIYSGYQSIMSGEMPVLYKMKDLWTFFADSFPDSENLLKKIRKANHFSEYEIAVNNMFRC